MIRKVELLKKHEPFAEPTSLGLIGLALGCAALTPIAFGHTTQTQQSVTVEFFGEGVDTQTIKVRYAENVEVTCHLP